MLPATLNVPPIVVLFATARLTPVFCAYNVPYTFAAPAEYKLKIVLFRYNEPPPVLLGIPGPTVKLFCTYPEDPVPCTCNCPLITVLFATLKLVPAPWSVRVPVSLVQLYLPIALISIESALVATIQSPKVLA